MNHVQYMTLFVQENEQAASNKLSISSCMSYKGIILVESSNINGNKWSRILYGIGTNDEKNWKKYS